MGGILCYLVRYGKPGFVGRFGSIRPSEAQRGDAVVVETDRGTERGELLVSAGEPSDKNPAGELLRKWSDEDERNWQALREAHLPILADAQKRIDERQAGVILVDGEMLLDRRSVILYYLGPATEKLGPLAVQLGFAHTAHVRFQSLEETPVTSVHAEPAVSEAHDIPRSSDTRAAAADDEHARTAESAELAEPLATEPLAREERIKRAGPDLLGTIPDELAGDKRKLRKENAFLLQFHGVYQQEDRDLRRSVDPEARRAQFMLRVKVPGGRLTASQMLATLEVADQYGNATVRITSRQGLQLHGVARQHLTAAVRQIQSSLLTTWGSCGDVLRNVVCCPAPRAGDPVHRRLWSIARELALQLLPQNDAYERLWHAAGEDHGTLAENPEPIYGPHFLPHKFKLALALPDDNCVDILTHDLGLLGVTESRGGERRLIGFNLLVGGGLGFTPARDETYRRLASPLGFVDVSDVFDAVLGLVRLQRDHGTRTDRRQARFKYLVERWGLERLREELARQIGAGRLQAAREVDLAGAVDHLGWHEQGEGRLYLGLPVESGRIRDTDASPLKTVLMRLLREYPFQVRLTPAQDLLLCDVAPELRSVVDSILREFKIPTVESLLPIRRLAMSCPALPTCGLAITEAERVFPQILQQLEALLRELGLERDSLSMRMTGCPNGCARPYTADIGLVGRAVDRYSIYLGGDASHLNELLADSVPRAELAAWLRPILASFARERGSSESFSGYCRRVGVERLKQLAGGEEGRI